MRDRDGNGRVVSGDGSVEKGVDPEVLERPVRRRFTAKYKRQIVEEAESHREDGGIGAIPIHCASGRLVGERSGTWVDLL